MHKSHHPCPAQTKQCRQILPGPEDEDKCSEHPREWLGAAVAPAADTHRESNTEGPQPQPLPRVNTWQQHEGLSPLLCWQHGALGGARAAGCIPIEEAEAGSALWEQLVAHAGGQPCQAVCPHNARLPARHQPPLRVQVGAEAHLWEKSGS